MATVLIMAIVLIMATDLVLIAVLDVASIIRKTLGDGGAKRTYSMLEHWIWAINKVGNLCFEYWNNNL